jgi:hypothetical protein
MYLERTLSLIKVYVDFAGRATDVDYLNTVGELQQSEAGSQRSVDCSRECGVRDGAGLCVLKQLTPGAWTSMDDCPYQTIVLS